MMLIPKSPPLEDKAKLAYVRTLPCVVCHAPPPSVAAHVRMGLAGGMSLKPADQLTVALCDSCHRQQHVIGEEKFWIDAFASVKPLRVGMLRAYARSLRP